MAKLAAKTKSTSTKKAPAKRIVQKKKTSSAAVQSSFFDARLTDQSLYWIIFGVAAIGFALWLFSLDAKVRDLYDQLDANSYNLDSSLYVKPKADQVQD